jgi:hypothetical protein
MRNRGSTPTEHIVHLSSFAQAQYELAKARDEGREQELRQNILNTVARLRESERSSSSFKRRATLSFNFFRRKTKPLSIVPEILPRHRGNNVTGNQTSNNKSDNEIKKKNSLGNQKHSVIEENSTRSNEQLNKVKTITQNSKEEKNNENSVKNKESLIQNAKEEDSIKVEASNVNRTPTTIQILDFYRCTKLTDKSLSEVALKCASSLRILDLSYCPQLSDSSVALLANCRLLEDLR